MTQKTTAKAATTPTYKPGQKVRHAAFGAGKVVEIKPTARGIWLAVDFGDRKAPSIKSVRPGTVAKA